MDTRVFGLRDSFTALDGRLERAAPDCGSVLDLIVWDKATERVVEDEQADSDVPVYKSGADTDEFYSCDGWPTFGQLADSLLAFLVTRQLICGPGAISGGSYCLAPPRDGITAVAPAAAKPRPLFSTRDAPARRRLTVTLSAPAMSEPTMLLKAGSTDLVLRMAEVGALPPELALDRPLQALAEVSRDLAGRARVRLGDGRRPTALDLQRAYLHGARNYTERHGTDPGTDRVIALWDKTLTAIESGNLDPVATEIDWVIKQRLIEEYQSLHGLPLSAPLITGVANAYHDISRGHGLYYRLEQAGQVTRTATDEQITAAKTTKPPARRYPRAG